MFTKAKESRGNHWRTSICSFETRITFDWVVNWEGSPLKVKLGSWRKRNVLVALEMNTEKFSRSASVTWHCHYGLASAVYHVLIFFFLLLVRSDRYDLYSCKKPYKWPSLTALKEKVWYDSLFTPKGEQFDKCNWWILLEHITTTQHVSRSKLWKNSVTRKLENIKSTAIPVSTANSWGMRRKLSRCIYFTACLISN